MNAMHERLAIRLFWKAEHLDPSEEGDCPESEWFGDDFPSTMDERRREFWRLLADEALFVMGEPIPEIMLKAGRECKPFQSDWTPGQIVAATVWREMLKAARRP